LPFFLVLKLELGNKISHSQALLDVNCSCQAELGSRRSQTGVWERDNKKGCVMNKLTKKQTAELNHLVSLSDEAIDTGDIPEQTHWQNATVGRFYSATHQSKVKLDNDILAWFKANNGRHYQKMINQALRDYMQQLNKPM
jgi:uncharacterized protein (DUF4415 family)